MQTPPSQITSSRLAKIAGYILIVCGIGHLLLGILGTLGAWQTIARAGFWNTITPPWMQENMLMQRNFWAMPGSFAIPLAILGYFIIWTAAQNQPLPRSLGWLVLAFMGLLSILVPVSGSWMGIVAAILLIIHTRRQQGRRLSHVN